MKFYGDDFYYDYDPRIDSGIIYKVENNKDVGFLQGDDAFVLHKELESAEKHSTSIRIYDRENWVRKRFDEILSDYAREENTVKKMNQSGKIRQLRREGIPEKQAVAISYSELRRGKIKRNPSEYINKMEVNTKFLNETLDSLNDVRTLINDVAGFTQDLIDRNQVSNLKKWNKVSHILWDAEKRIDDVLTNKDHE
jgi:hypothetical protein